MGKEIVYRCDAPGCHSVRGNTNHWFIFLRETCQLLPPLFKIAALSVKNEDWLSDTEYSGVVCSVGCAQKVFETFLQNTLQATNNPHETNPFDQPN